MVNFINFARCAYMRQRRACCSKTQKHSFLYYILRRYMNVIEITVKILIYSIFQMLTLIKKYEFYLTLHNLLQI